MNCPLAHPAFSSEAKTPSRGREFAYETIMNQSAAFGLGLDNFDEAVKQFLQENPGEGEIDGLEEDDEFGLGQYGQFCWSPNLTFAGQLGHPDFYSGFVGGNEGYTSLGTAFSTGCQNGCSTSDQMGPDFIPEVLSTPRAGIYTGLGHNETRFLDSENIIHNDVVQEPGEFIPDSAFMPLTLQPGASVPGNDGCGFASTNTTGREFRFESRCVIIEDRSNGRKTSRTSVNTDGLKCEYPGCRYRGTFKRKYELQRHVKKHTNGEIYSCPIVGCDRTEKESKAYYRADKFVDHFKKTHTDDDTSLCPITTCRIGPFSLDLRMAHVQYHIGTKQDFISAALR
ncbi:hypothetical protein K469DRAFT_748213 [Zopfia rhizophila CBS 207.26]|uniref:C2H2-type domain-containing protein n=1 Tax=Zopfia rhizophila CBS 207.26 TaxID=1314779 RepID=A0A6A6EB66_9PEZI|nr:hypothetical protein K469DRAFT_748213 [Zopfia rhizophila CBS 207.26]